MLIVLHGDELWHEILAQDSLKRENTSDKQLNACNIYQRKRIVSVNLQQNEDSVYCIQVRTVRAHLHPSEDSVCQFASKCQSETVKQAKRSTTLTPFGKTFVYKWHKRFCNHGRLSIKDDTRAGRPAQVNSKIDRVKDHIYKDRRATVRSIGDDLVISISTIYRILTDEQGMSKVSARWVPP
ncbi:GVQW3-like protein [Mya arenaria]|uniref:GVQW3-like protein n=1 Tax=Mya arenaria TaxID=6604 RepID=A0ABY7G3Q8_MYAAR|nr:GVQW3-like protein [Mya arenaria]